MSRKREKESTGRERESSEREERGKPRERKQWEGLGRRRQGRKNEEEETELAQDKSCLAEWSVNTINQLIP